MTSGKLPADAVEAVRAGRIQRGEFIPGVHPDHMNKAIRRHLADALPAIEADIRKRDASEIESLRAERDELREALERVEYACICVTPGWGFDSKDALARPCLACSEEYRPEHHIARAALQQAQETLGEGSDG